MTKRCSAARKANVTMYVRLAPAISSTDRNLSGLSLMSQSVASVVAKTTDATLCCDCCATFANIEEGCTSR